MKRSDLMPECAKSTPSALVQNAPTVRLMTTDTAADFTLLKGNAERHARLLAARQR